MKKSMLDDDVYPVYPGAYVPALGIEEVEIIAKRSRSKKSFFPPVVVTELPESYKVQVTIPGVKREDFFIEANANVITVSCIHLQEPNVYRRYLNNLHPVYKCLWRLIKLPDDADVEFVSAEYTNGTFCMYAPKFKKSNQRLHANIVVY